MEKFQITPSLRESGYLPSVPIALNKGLITLDLPSATLGKHHTTIKVTVNSSLPSAQKTIGKK